MFTAIVIGVIVLLVVLVNQIVLMFMVAGTLKQNEAFKELLFGNEHVVSINELNGR